MRFSLKVSAAVHILLVAHFFSETKRITGRLLTKSTGCNPVVVRTLVLSLKHAGIMEVTRGPQGGARLLRDPREISLWDVYAAVDPESMDAMARGIHTTSSQFCPVGRWIFDVLKGPYEKVAGVIEREMRAITLADIASGLPEAEIENFKEILSRTRTEDLPDRAGPPGQAGLPRPPARPRFHSRPAGPVPANNRNRSPKEESMYKEVLEFIQASRPFYLATIKDLGPKVRPLGFVMEYHGKIYFGVGTHKQVYRQMVDNPLVEIAATGKDGDWLRLTGLAVFDDDPDLFDSAVQSTPMLKEIYPPDGTKKLGFFHLKEATALFYDHIKDEVRKTVKL
jgi:uncharacterized pyridoxamine 5'-phosphate oxidase family protein/DNA-binding IscR family transcriptional regulator